MRAVDPKRSLEPLWFKFCLVISFRTFHPPVPNSQNVPGTTVSNGGRRRHISDQQAEVIGLGLQGSEVFLTDKIFKINRSSALEA
jgi:hypothetical protein